MLKHLLAIALTFSVLQTFAGEAGDTIHIYFERNIEKLNAPGQATIDSLSSSGYISPGAYLYIVGYADYLGNEEHNKELSEARARNVADYLAGLGVKKENIKLCLGKGQVERFIQKNANGYPTDRRVDIVVINAYVPPPTDTIVKTTIRPGKTAKKTGRILVDEQDGGTAKHHPKKADQGEPSRILEDDPSNVNIVVKPGAPKHIPEDFRRSPGDKKTIADIAKYKKGETIVLENIYFYPESHMVREQSTDELLKLYALLEKNPKLKIRIEGHVCCVTDVEDAFDIDSQDNHLSLNRAKYIYDYLVKKGVNAGRLEYAGYGRSKPVVAVELNEADANKNRRVEIRIMDK